MSQFTHARSCQRNAWRCAKIAGSMRKQIVPLRVYCGHIVLALRELCVSNACSAREQDANTASRHAACHRNGTPRGNKMRASVGAALSGSDLKFFADDTNLFLSTRDINVLNLHCNDSIDALNNWFVANRLHANLDKTNIVVFPNNKAIYSDIHYHCVMCKLKMLILVDI